VTPETFTDEELMRLDGKTALITGSTSGIGLGIARSLARRGANIVLNGFGDVEGSIEQIAALGVKVGYHGADMSKKDDIAQLIDYVQSEFGGTDILVNNAGIQHVARIKDFPDDEWDRVIAINMRRSLPHDETGTSWNDRKRLGPYNQHRLGTRTRGIGRKSRLRDGQARCRRSHQNDSPGRGRS